MIDSRIFIQHTDVRGEISFADVRLIKCKAVCRKAITEFKITVVQSVDLIISGSIYPDLIKFYIVHSTGNKIETTRTHLAIYVAELCFRVANIDIIFSGW